MKQLAKLYRRRVLWPVYKFRGLILHKLWAMWQHSIWNAHAQLDQLKQIVNRLEKNENTCPPDTRAALNLAKALLKRLDPS